MPKNLKFVAPENDDSEESEESENERKPLKKKLLKKIKKIRSRSGSKPASRNESKNSSRKGSIAMIANRKGDSDYDTDDEELFKKVSKKGLKLRSKMLDTMGKDEEE